MKKSKIHVVLIFLLFSLMLIGCSNVEPIDIQETNDVKSVNDDLTDHSIDLEGAYNVFMEAYPDGLIKEIGYKKHGDSYVYEVEGYKGRAEYEIKIDAKSGEILKTEVDNDNKETRHISKEDIDKVPALIKKAMEDAGEGSQLIKWELDLERDGIEFEIELLSSNNRKIESKSKL